jgi:hypothetical protein
VLRYVGSVLNLGRSRWLEIGIQAFNQTGSEALSQSFLKVFDPSCLDDASILDQPSLLDEVIQGDRYDAFVIEHQLHFGGSHGLARRPVAHSLRNS